MSIIIPPFIGSPYDAAEGKALAVDEVMLREPRLLVPRMQPIGPVKIDWSNPLANGVCIFVYGGIELVNGVTGTYASAATLGLLNGNRASYRPNTTNDLVKFVLPPSASLYNLGNTDTIAVRARITALSNYNCLVSVPYSESVWNSPWLSFGLCADNSGTEVSHWVARSTTEWEQAYRIAYIAAGNTYDICVSRNSTVYSTNVNDYIVADVTGYYSYTGSPVFTNKNPLYVGCAGAAATTGWSIAGLHEYAVIWNRALTENQRRRFQLDPYQFLIPA